MKAKAINAIAILTLVAGLVACSPPFLTEEEIAACKTQIKISTGNDLADETYSGSNLNVENTSRSSTIGFEGTDKHPEYVCVLEGNVVITVIEQKKIYERPS